MKQILSLFISILLASISISAQIIATDFVVRYKSLKQIEYTNGKIRNLMLNEEIAVDKQSAIITTERRKGVKLASQLNCLLQQTKAFLSDGYDYYSYDESNYDNRLIKIIPRNGSVESTELKDDTKLINGRYCLKALMKITGYASPLEIWYEKGTLLKPACFDYVFKDIPGIPVAILFDEGNQYNLSIIQSIYNVYLLDTFFIPTNIAEYAEIKNPEKYKSTTGSLQQSATQAQKMLAAGDEIEMPSQIKELLVYANKKTESATPSKNKITDQDIKPDSPFGEGSKLPAFSAALLSGGKFETSNLGDNVTILNFWFTSCAPCIKEMPVLNALVDSFAGKPVSFYAFTYEKTDEVENFLKKKQFKFNHAVDAKSIIDKLGVSQYPLTIILDKKGLVRYISQSEIITYEQIKNQINRLL